MLELSGGRESRFEFIDTPQLSGNVLEFAPMDERIAFLCLRVLGWGLSVVCP